MTDSQQVVGKRGERLLTFTRIAHVNFGLLNTGFVEVCSVIGDFQFDVLKMSETWLTFTLFWCSGVYFLRCDRDRPDIDWWWYVCTLQTPNKFVWTCVLSIEISLLYCKYQKSQAVSLYLVQISKSKSKLSPLIVLLSIY